MVPLAVLLAQLLDKSWQLPMLVIVMIVAGVACYWANSWRSACCIAVLALASMQWVANVRDVQASWLHRPQPHTLLVGKVVGLPVRHPDHVEFIFKTQKIAGKPCVRNLALQWYQSPGQPRIKVGQIWQWVVNLRPLHSLHNPDSYTHERSWLAQAVSARGSVEGRHGYRLLGQDRSIRSRIARWRSQILDGLMANTTLAYAGLIVALLLGVRDGITTEQWQLFQHTGTSHLIAISGLHIGLVAGLVGGLAKWSWRRSAHCCEWLPAPLFARFAGVIAGGAYSVLAGLSVSTQRAFFLLATGFLLSLRRQLLPLSQLLLWVAVLIALSSPLLTLNIGYWLSFLAVAWLIYGCRLPLGDAKWRQAWHSQWRVQIGTLPVIVACFLQVSICSIWVNAWAIPLFSIVMVPLSLLGLLWHHAWALVDHCWLWVLVAMQWFVGLPGSFQVVMPPPWWAVACGVFGALGVLAPWRGRWLMLGWLLPLFFLPVAKPLTGEAWINVLDVGQGLATVVQTATHTLVFDTGANYRGFVNRGAQVVVPFLQHQGIGKVDALMISHGDNDHAGGAQAVLDALPVDWLLGQIKHPLSRKVTPCRAGQHWQWDGVAFRVLWPIRLGHGNNYSCVLQVQAKQRRAILTGDIEAPAERALVQQYGAALASDVLLVPHHGSQTSSTSEFLAAVRPKWAVFSVGFFNRFHFPKPIVVARYLLAGATVLRTDWLGALKITMSDTVTVAPYWRHLAWWD